MTARPDSTRAAIVDDAHEWNLFGPYSSPKEIDAAIDAAMKEAK